MSGPTILCGCPGSGKTFKAHELALAEVGRSGYPLLVIDSARVDRYAAMHHAATVRETVERIWGEGLHTAYTPEDPEDFDRLAAAARAGKNVVIEIDELKNVLPSTRSMSLPFQLMVRLWRHSNIPAIYATTQSYADAARPLRAVASEWYFFRMTAPADLDAIRQDHGLDPVELAQLPKYEFKHVKAGF